MEPVEELSVSGLQTLLSDFSSGVLGQLNLDFDFDFVGGILETSSSPLESQSQSPSLSACLGEVV